MRRFSGCVKPTVAAIGRLQGVQCGIARLQDVRGIRCELCESLQGADGGGGAQKRRGKLLRSLPAQSGGLPGQGFNGIDAREISVGRAVS